MPGVGSLRWACTFHIFCADFICVGHPTQTRFLVEYGLYSLDRVPTQVLQSLIKSYICFSIYKALQSLIFWYFRPNRSYKVLFLIEKDISALTI